MLDIRKNSIYDVYCISRCLYQCYSNNLFFFFLGGGGGRGGGGGGGGGVVSKGDGQCSARSFRQKNCFEHRFYVDFFMMF